MKCYSDDCEKDAIEGTIFCEDCDSFPKSSMSKEEIINIAKDVLKSTFATAISQLHDNFYKKLSELFYEHDNNYRTKILNEAMDLICGKAWARYKNDYDMKIFRAKVYNEHKEELDKKITEQVIDNEIQRYFGLYLTDDEKTRWQYSNLEEKVMDWIVNNYSKSKILKSKLPKKLIFKIERLQSQNNSLQQQLNNIRDITN